MRKILYISLFVGFASFASAQENPIFSQYFVNELAYNQQLQVVNPTIHLLLLQDSSG